jgi:HAD superfamily hydrolase (TIGR01490 family)
VSLPLQTTPPDGIALFDLDGTLLAWDCQLLFRHFIVRREPWRAMLLPVFLTALPFAGLLGTERMKRVFLSFLWRMPPDRSAHHAREFAASLLPAIYQDLRGKLEAHRSRGHLLILASASPEFYVKEIGRELGFDIALGTEVATGPFLPRLRNHKGAAKVARLRKILPPNWFVNDKLPHCHGYTDSRADLPMLELCDTATVVNPSPDLTRIAEESGWEIVRPKRPWNSRAGFMLRTAALLVGIGRNPAGIPRS